MNRVMRIPSLALAFLLAAATSAQANVVLDQEYYQPPVSALAPLSENATPTRRIQTFTVGVSGILRRVEVPLSCSCAGVPPEARIIATAGGVPTGTVLASTTITDSPNAEWRGYDFAGANLSVTQGDVLGLELMQGTTSSLWMGINVGTYPGGAMYYQNPSNSPGWTQQVPELWFRTYVDPAAVPASASTWGRIKQNYR
jgi:hypothetical protein